MRSDEKHKEEWDKQYNRPEAGELQFMGQIQHRCLFLYNPSAKNVFYISKWLKK